MPRSTLARLLDGAPLALPGVADRLSERWWAARPRVRAAILLAAAGLVVLIGVAHVTSSPFGPPRTVLVATADLPAGHTLSSSDLRATGWPRDLVPAGVLAPRADWVGRTLGGPLPANSVATDRHLGDLGLADLVPEGYAGVPVPLDLLPRLAVGTRLDLVGRDINGHALALASDVRVLGDDGDAMWLAVAPRDAPAVAAAAAAGMLTTVVRGH